VKDVPAIRIITPFESSRKKHWLAEKKTHSLRRFVKQS
jgi:hypothetical protein